jgi:hypothetical protein
MSKPPHSVSYADQGHWPAGAARSGVGHGTAPLARDFAGSLD